jgi:alpha-glucosidase
VNSFCRPETLEKLRPIRTLLDEYPGVMSMGEVTLCEDSIALSGSYVEGKERLHLAYNSALLRNEPLSAQMFQTILARTQKHFPEAGQCWMAGNHDYGRFRSRWSGHDSDGRPYPESTYHMMAALLTALPGALCLYQGDELGLPEARIPADIPEAKIRDSFGKALYPVLPGRDGSRTPMPWLAEGLHHGFTEAPEPWLPIPPSHRTLTVDRQSCDPSSLLNTWRRLLHWRRSTPALLHGNLTVLGTQEPILAFLRHDAQRVLLCLFNTSRQQAVFHAGRHGLAVGSMQVSLAINATDLVPDHGDDLICDPYAAIFLTL